MGRSGKKKISSCKPTYKLEPTSCAEVAEHLTKLLREAGLNAIRRDKTDGEIGIFKLDDVIKDEGWFCSRLSASRRTSGRGTRSGSGGSRTTSPSTGWTFRWTGCRSSGWRSCSGRSSRRAR